MSGEGKSFTCFLTQKRFLHLFRKIYHFVNAESEAAFDEYVAKCKELSLYDTGASAAYGDKLITLSTCEYSQTNGRMVVVAKKVASPQAEVAGNEA